MSLLWAYHELSKPPMYVRIAKRVRGRGVYSVPRCTESPLSWIPTDRSIMVGIPSSGDSVQWGFRTVGIPGIYHATALQRCAYDFSK